MSTNPISNPNELAAWQSQSIVMQAMIDAVIHGEVTALNRMTPDRPRTFRGITAYLESWQALIDNLRPYGFEKEEKNNQLRLLVPDGFTNHSSRLLLCRGRREGGTIEVNPKGNLTRILINQQNSMFGPQTAMPFFEDEQQQVFQNYWIVSEVKKTLLTIYLTLPYWINDTGTVIESVDAAVLHIVDLNTVPYAPADLPQPLPIEVTLGERDGTGG